MAASGGSKNEKIFYYCNFIVWFYNFISTSVTFWVMPPLSKDGEQLVRTLISIDKEKKQSTELKRKESVVRWWCVDDTVFANEDIIYKVFEIQINFVKP